jgi:hypothetical protein
MRVDLSPQAGRGEKHRNRCALLPLSGIMRPDQFRFTPDAKCQLNPVLSC